MDGRVALPKNMVLDEAYRVERIIASGGFGITYAADDIKLNTRVALKENYPADFGERDASLSVQPKSADHRKTFEWGRSSFLKEAQTLAKFRHPSIVRVSRVFEALSTAYMVMDFEAGQSLEEWLKGLRRAPTQEELDTIVAPLLDALKLMHSADFLHRDLAPDNIIVRADGTPVLLDFGAARRAVAEMSRTLTGIVKTGYSPHEQYATDGRLQGPWTDIYAFGATLYRAVTGAPPEEATLRVTDDKVLSAVQAAKGTYRPNFLNAIDECLKVRPRDRPQSVTQVRPMLLDQETQRIASRERIAGTRKIERAPSRLARTKWRWLAATAALALLVGSYGGFEYTRRSAEQQARLQVEALQDAEVRRQAEAEAKKKDEEARSTRVAVPQPPAPQPPSSPMEPAPTQCDGMQVILGNERLCFNPGAGKTESFKDCPTCPEMLVVPAGSFTMGSPANEPGRDKGETQVRVTIPAPFAVGRFAVTFDEWDACVADRGCNGYKPADEGWGRGKHPVINVNWDDAKAYAAWLSRKTGKAYRLLSETEREYVTRAGTTTPFWWGSSITPKQANYDGDYPYAGGAKGEYRERTVPVDSFEPNPWGLYNVHGNVWDWTEDCRNDSNTGNPGDGRPRTTGDCSSRVVRGGTWYSFAQYLRSADRLWNSAVFRASFQGFRLARTLNP